MFKYFKFFIESTNQHGVHSPFVYHLTTKAFYTKTETDISKKLKSALKRSGKNSFSSLKKARLFYKIIHYFDAKHILTIASTPQTIFTLAADISKIHKITSLNDKNVPAYVSNTKQEQQQIFDVIFISTEALNFINPEDLYTLSEKNTHDGTAIILDRIHSSESTNKKWLELKNNLSFNVTIDLYHCGLLFKRQGQQKEHFCIRV
ncbi:hypothetical protein MQE36_10940 [Zhouia spongiae]|uniref:Class I SAM-dependent methyltransferase n=1 Tax=Zhouia spongiae TaxID=2202721 RepID=A0ABY3YIX7_9FLAO|nr:hypothetical protein [Zhouia spongiae]UNY97600.1 hypothetical protein MQE36_10940 [Zhouia spongiae]